MPFTTRTSSRVLALIGLIVGLAVVTEPALAGTNQSGPLDPWAYALVHRSAAETQQYGPLDPWAYALVNKSAATPEQTPLDPWAYALVHKSAATPEQSPPDVRAHVIREAEESGLQSVAPDTSETSAGMDWGSAGIGAAGAFGLVILLAGGTIIVRRRSALPRLRF
jgi:hypothetical protein